MAAASCSCSNISIMQLFHELKQRFPAVPDRVVSECIRKNFHDRHSCEAILRRENQDYLLHSYPAALKMCAAASEPTSPLATTFHRLNFCDRLSPRSRPLSDTGPSHSVGHADSNWFEDAVLGLQVNEAGNTDVRARPHQAELCSDSFLYWDQLKRYFPSPLDQDFPMVPGLFSQMSEESEDGAGWDELTGDTVHKTSHRSNNCKDSRVGHYHLQRGDVSEPLVPVSSRSNDVTTSGTYHRHKARPSSLSVRSQNVLGMDEAQPSPLMSEAVDTSSGVLPGICTNELEVQRSLCDSLSSAAQCSRKDNMPMDNFQFNMNCSLEQSPLGSSVNITSSTEPKQRVRSILEVQPLPHYSSLDYRAHAGRSHDGSFSRSYTSVNLTLRPPSSEPQPPIDIRSAGSSLTYSTLSFDPHQGYQSQLQIRIGPGASGSVTAVRTRTRDPTPVPASLRCAYTLARSDSLPDVSRMLSLISEASEGSSSSSLEEQTAAAHISAMGADDMDLHTRELLSRQVDRKTRLQKELHKEKDKLRRMQKEAQAMKQDLEQRQLLKMTSSSFRVPVATTVLQRVQQLRLDIQWLQEQCKQMTNEVDFFNSDTAVPLGETDEEFYKNIYTGQRGHILPPRAVVSVRPKRKVAGQRSSHWTCNACTYKNHPLLDKCEQCDMLHIDLGAAPAHVATTAL